MKKPAVVVSDSRGEKISAFVTVFQAFSNRLKVNAFQQKKTDFSGKEISVLARTIFENERLEMLLLLT
jgi:hypothetical protein